MPYINLQITKGVTREQKKRIVEDFTSSLVAHLGKKPEHIHIVIEEIDDENWGYAGMLTDDYRKQSAEKESIQPNKAEDPLATRVTPPAEREPRHGQP